MQPKLLVISNYRDPVAPIRPEAEIFLRLAKEGFRITVMTPADGAYSTILKDAGCQIIDYLPKSKFDPKAVKLIKKCVDDSGINLIHAFNSKAIANASRAVWNNKNVKLLSYRGYTGNIHWYDPSLYLTYLNPRIDKMVCLAESVREQYIKNGVSPNRAITINKGHDPAWYTDIPEGDLSEFRIDPETVVCSFVANQRTKMKGVADVVEAASLLDEKLSLKFLMIGDGLKTDPIDRLIKELGVGDRLIFTGYRSDAASLVRSSDMSLSASHFGEATQKAVIEAMQLGNPMILTDISGNRGMVRDGECGFVIPPGSPKDIAASATKLASDEGLRIQMGKAAQEHISRFLSIDRSVKEYGDLYCSLLAD